jgi:GNAT superfamily N-acetyltransferase
MTLVTTTYLEMRSPEELRAKRCEDPRFWIREATVRQWEYNRFLYALVGSPWAWRDKCPRSDEEWRDYVEAEGLRTFCAYHDGSPAGYYELRQDASRDVEIAYFGLAPKFIGRGFGGALLTSALEEAWRLQPGRVWVHTCSLDHPAALANYRARGMKAYKTETHEAR